jgi:hypothetical protein
MMCVCVCTVDDGVYPLLGNIGPSSIALFTGSTFQQSWLANIAEEIDVSKVGTVNWAVDPNVGPSGKPKLVMPVERTSRVTWADPRRRLQETTISSGSPARTLRIPPRLPTRTQPIPPSLRACSRFLHTHSLTLPVL